MQLLLILLSSVCASLPMMAFLAFVWWMDRYDREPVGMIALAFSWGATGAVMFALVGSALMSAVVAVGAAAVVGADSPDLGAITGAAIPLLVAPLIEEPSKALILVPIALSRHFDNMTDGFVYGAAAGLGFAMTENFLYFVQTSGDVGVWLGTVVIRTFFSAVMHATATSIAGAAVGWGRFRGAAAVAVVAAVGLAMAMAVHGTWNGLLALDAFAPNVSLAAIDLVLLPLLTLGIFAVFEVCILDEGIAIRTELGEEARHGRLPAEHVPIIASWWRRLGRRWVPPGIDRDAYVATATALAMRKRQIRLLGTRAPAWYGDEVARHRQALSAILAAR